MSDSGRQLGECQHQQTREWCPTCLRERIAELERENARLSAVINYPCTPLFEGREATQNERHLLNLLSWREKEVAELKAELAKAKAQNERTYCAYCGHEESVDADGSVIALHIATCEKHPMRAVEAELATLRASQRARENAAARWGYVKALHRVRRHASQAIDGVEEMHLPADWTPEKGGE